MGVADFLWARRLRAGRALLLGYQPDPALLLETVRLCSPIAYEDRKGVRVTRKMRLRGPIDLTPSLAARAGLPTGWRTAYVLEDTWRDIGGRSCLPWDVVEGLARRLNGCAHPPPRPGETLSSVVGGPEIPTPRLAELLAEVLPGLRFHDWIDDETISFRSETSPISVLFIRYSGGIEYSIEVEDPAALTPDILATGELAALLIAEEAGGTALDLNGFLLPPRNDRGGHPPPYGAASQGGKPYSGGRRRVRRVWAAAGAGLVLTLVTVAITLAVLAGTTPGSGDGLWAVGETTAPAPSKDRQIRLPGSSITIHESDEDPIRLTSYTLGTGDEYRLHIRGTGTHEFVKNDEYGHYTSNPSGTHALATARAYSTDNYEIVSIIDHRTGEVSDVKTAKAPFYGLYPRWSPDGTKGLITLYGVVKGETVPRVRGYTIIDIATKKASVVRVKDKDIGEWPYFWRADSQAVGTWTITKDTRQVRFYDLRGTVLQTLPDVGAPIWVEGENTSPSGTLMITYCAETQEVCVWSTTGDDGEPKVRIPFETDRIIGWYDDQHIVAWREQGSGHEAVLIDFKGTVKRVLATSAEDDEGYARQFMLYTRAG
ncbi:hypothetical protein [Streptosporangium sp. NPDC049644]|uniref:hypothetical protein n=1 Tax=Streptosporangium sp. NPDC049644 TaxID=3155507 RepID=UPI003446EAC4